MNCNTLKYINNNNQSNCNEYIFLFIFVEREAGGGGGLWNGYSGINLVDAGV